MQHELHLMQKLIERKKAYLQRVEKQNVKDALQAEINIIERYMLAVNNQLIDNERTQHINHLQKQIELLQLQKMKLEGICLLHGIDDVATN